GPVNPANTTKALSFPGTQTDNTRPMPQTTYATSTMTYTSNVANPAAISPTVMLRRLACPGLPPNEDLNNVSDTNPYNPYITVDYVEDVPMYNGSTNFTTNLPNVDP